PMELTADEDGVIRAFPVKECRPLLADGDDAIVLGEKGFVVKRQYQPDVVCKAEIKDIKVLRDEYILEIFVNGGEEVYSVVLW
ncbi:MAG: hypothetical protein J5760_00785, partial [Clostridia bacterium]|nr:hypothetical protein [Clostridia bacterium]